MEEKDWLAYFSSETQLKSVMKVNEYTGKFGLSLSQEQAQLLVKERLDSLKEQQRIEFGEGILPKLIFAFCDSPYIYQDNYVDSIGRLQEIFYLYKNESLDEVSDDELIEFMKQAFNGECEGSLDHLEDTALEKFARMIRENTLSFMGSRRDEDD